MERTETSSDFMSDFENLVKLDLAKGTSLALIVFYCCKLGPTQKLRNPIQKAVELGLETARTDEGKIELVRDIFEFRDKLGMNCFNILFQCAAENDLGRYNNIDIFEDEIESERVKWILRNKRNSETEDKVLLIEQIEKSFTFLKDLALSIDFNVRETRPGKNGRTLLHLASKFSEKITEFLIDFGVEVNIVSYAFETPLFKVIACLKFNTGN